VDFATLKYTWYTHVGISTTAVLILLFPFSKFPFSKLNVKIIAILEINESQYEHLFLKIAIASGGFN